MVVKFLYTINKILGVAIGTNSGITRRLNVEYEVLKMTNTSNVVCTECGCDLSGVPTRWIRVWHGGLVDLKCYTKLLAAEQGNKIDPEPEQLTLQFGDCEISKGGEDDEL